MKRLVPWCILFIFGLIGLYQAFEIKRFPPTSLRYSQPISGQTAYRARQYAIDNPDTPWPTFWNETAVWVSARYGGIDTIGIVFSGNANCVWPAVYIAGGAPSPIDSAGVAVSEALAHRLWGSIDVVGMVLVVDGEDRIVRGVFKNGAELALIPYHIEDTSRDWHNVELYGSATEPTRVNAERFATASGLGNPDHILTGGLVAFVAFVPMLPVFIIAAYNLIMLARYIKKRFPLYGTIILFAAAFVFIVFLPYMLESMPSWMVPTRWGDFAFWSSLFRQTGEGMKEFLRVPPTTRDVELRLILVKQMGVLLIMACNAIAIQVRRG
ncbi:MAG: hypothetical protein FWD90_10365 [Defluviitaleaceae bacterium]|nr:hypothetical protein [Defluviitaleaceae bacterium]